MAVLAAVGLGVQALSGVGSFLQAGQRQKEIDKANKAAREAVNEAKKQIQLKPYEALTVSDSPYERQREMFAAQAAQATQAAAEMGAAGMGRVGAVAMAANEAQAKIQAEKTQKLEGIDLLKAGDELRVAKELGQLAKDEAAGAQLAARDAQAAKTAAITSGFGSITGAAKGLAAVNPVTGEAIFGLYGKDKSGGAAGAGAGAGGDAIAKFGQETQGQRDLSMALATGSPIAPRMNTSLPSASQVLSNPFLNQDNILSGLGASGAPMSSLMQTPTGQIIPSTLPQFTTLSGGLSNPYIYQGG